MTDIDIRKIVTLREVVFDTGSPQILNSERISAPICHRCSPRGVSPGRSYIFSNTAQVMRYSATSQ